MEDSTCYDHSSETSEWRTVTSKRRKGQTQQNKNDNKHRQNGSLPGVAGDKVGNVFSAIEEQSRNRRLRVVESQKEAEAADLTSRAVRSKNQRGGRFDDDDGDSSEEEGRQNGVVEEEKKKLKKAKKKEKKPKVTVAEAAARIVPSELEAFIADVTGKYESQEDIQLKRFADFFVRAFSKVGAAQFPWVKNFRESTPAKLTEIPLSNVPDAVYKISAEWINQRSIEALKSFVLGLLDIIVADLVSQVHNKGSKKGAQQPSSKSQVAVFVVLAMVLRRKPEVLINVLPTLRENVKYQGQDKLPIIVWMICQVCHGDLTVGLYAWAHNLLPVLNSKSSNNPQRELILQLAERIVAAPKARSILMSNPVRKGERLIPPSSFEILVRVAFPASSARTKVTEDVYRTLKDIALAGDPGSKAMKQVYLQIFSLAIKAAGDNIPELSKEGTSISIWCLAYSNECYKHWDKLYLDNVEASVSILRTMSEQWKELKLSQQSQEALKATVKSFQQKNANVLAEEDASKKHLVADKYGKILMGRLSSGHGCMKATAILAIMLAVCAASMSTNLESFDLKKVAVMLSSFQTV